MNKDDTKALRAQTAAQLATDVKEWRGDVSLAKAAPYLGIPRRTLEGVEQGRGFVYPDLLKIAMRAAKLPRVVK